MSCFGRSLNCRGFRLGFVEDLPIHECSIVVGVVVLVAHPVLAHRRHAHEVSDVVYGAFPMKVIKEAAISEEHLDVVKPELTIAAMLLLLLGISADGVKQIGIV